MAASVDERLARAFVELADTLVAGFDLMDFLHTLSERCVEFLDVDAARAARALVDVATIGILQERAVRQHELIAGQLQAALNSRVMIEQAKGILAERMQTTPDEAFVMVRSYARDHNRPLTELVREVITGTSDITRGDAARSRPSRRKPERPPRPGPVPGG